MFFSEEFIHSVEENPIVGIVDACKRLKTEAQNLSTDSWTEEAHELLWEGASFLDLVVTTNDFLNSSNKCNHLCSQQYL